MGPTAACATPAPATASASAATAASPARSRKRSHKSTVVGRAPCLFVYCALQKPRAVSHAKAKRTQHILVLASMAGSAVTLLIKKKLHAHKKKKKKKKKS